MLVSLRGPGVRWKSNLSSDTGEVVNQAPGAELFEHAAPMSARVREPTLEPGQLLPEKWHRGRRLSVLVWVKRKVED